MGHVVRADQILHALERKHRAAHDLFFTEVKTGSTVMAGTGDLRRIDAVAVKPSWTRQCITAYEVKVSRSDFTGDDKWPGYLDYCHRFSFACPAGLINPDELPREVGLVWYVPETGVLQVKRRAIHRPASKMEDMLYYLVIWRSDPERHPFFSDRREEIEAWLQDRKARRLLAEQFRSSLVAEAAEAALLRGEVETLRQRAEEAEARLERVYQALNKVGIYIYPSWDQDVERLIAQAMSRGMPESVPRLVRQLETEIRQLAELLEPDEGASA